MNYSVYKVFTPWPQLTLKWPFVFTEMCMHHIAMTALAPAMNKNWNEIGGNSTQYDGKEDITTTWNDIKLINLE